MRKGFIREGIATAVIRFTIGFIILLVIPVSYTHLDVYKRQTYAGATRSARA